MKTQKVSALLLFSVEKIGLRWYDMSEGMEKGESDMNTTMNVERPCTILESIEKSCQEVKLMREGKIPKRSWNDFIKRMKEEMTEDK